MRILPLAQRFLNAAGVFLSRFEWAELAGIGRGK